MQMIAEAMECKSAGLEETQVKTLPFSFYSLAHSPLLIPPPQTTTTKPNQSLARFTQRVGFRHN